jgi:hypothetical protein
MSSFVKILQLEKISYPVYQNQCGCGFATLMFTNAQGQRWPDLPPGAEAGGRGEEAGGGHHAHPLQQEEAGHQARADINLSCRYTTSLPLA